MHQIANAPSDTTNPPGFAGLLAFAAQKRSSYATDPTKQLELRRMCFRELREATEAVAEDIAAQDRGRARGQIEDKPAAAVTLANHLNRSLGDEADPDQLYEPEDEQIATLADQLVSDVSATTVAALAAIDRQIAIIRAPQEANAAEWLDTRELPVPPRPYSEDDWERDRRRAVAAMMDLAERARETGDTWVKGEAEGLENFELDHGVWMAYAEQGLDAVTEVLREQQGRLVDMLQRRGEFIIIEEQRRVDDERRRVAEDAASAAGLPRQSVSPGSR